MKLRSYIVEHKLTHKSFADGVGASERAVIKWCRGERTPRSETMIKIIAFTGGAVGPEDFLEQEAA